MKRRFLKFMAADDGGEGGGTAVAEAPMTNIGDVFTATLAKERGESPAEAPEKPVESSEPAKADKTPEKAPDEPMKPQSALEAALAEAPKEEVDTDPLKDLPETLPNENRKDHWKNARTTIKSQHDTLTTQAKELATLREQATATKDNPELLAKLAQREQENATLRDAITAANIELLPEFRAKYVDGRANLVGKAQEKIKAYGGDAEALKDALSMPEGRKRDAAINEAMSDMDDPARARVLRFVTEIEKLDEDAQAERGNSQQSLERYTLKQREQQQAHAQEFEARKTATFEAVTKQLQTTVPTLRLVDPSVPGAEEWNTGIKSAFEKSQRLFSAEASPEETVAAAVKGQDYDRISGLLSATQKELAQAKKQLAEFDGVHPDVKGGKAPAKTGAAALLEKSPGELYNQKMADLSNRED